MENRVYLYDLYQTVTETDKNMWHKIHTMTCSF